MSQISLADYNVKLWWIPYHWDHSKVHLWLWNYSHWVSLLCHLLVELLVLYIHLQLISKLEILVPIYIPSSLCSKKNTSIHQTMVFHFYTSWYSPWSTFQWLNWFLKEPTLKPIVGLLRKHHQKNLSFLAFRPSFLHFPQNFGLHIIWLPQTPIDIQYAQV